MKLSHISIVILLACLFFVPAVIAQAPASATAEVPRLIKLSGTLLDAQERPLSGPVGVTFALYAQQSGGAALWIETQNVKPDDSGNYTVLLGANTANGVPAELFVSGEARWLGIQVGQQPEHERILLVSVPYALKAGDAETLGGKPLSSFVLNEPQTAGTTSTAKNTQTAAGTSTKTSATPQAVTPCSSVTSDGAATANSIALFTTACNIESSVITQSSGNVGIGTATPAVAVDVAGNNAGLRLSGTGTHQVTVTGATSGRLGQDANGFFLASDTNGKSVRFLTNNGTLNEWMRITSTGNVGIGTPSPTQKLEIAGNLKVSGAGNAIIFPNGTVMSSAAPAASLVRAITYLAGCDSCSLLTNADSQNTIFVNLVGDMTINSVTCFSDAGTPGVNIQLNHGGTLSNVLSSNLICSTTGATSSSFSTSALSLNDSLNFTLDADGVAKRVTTIIKATVN